MKKHLFKIGSILLLFLTVQSCKKNDGIEPTQVINNHSNLPVRISNDTDLKVLSLLSSRSYAERLLELAKEGSYNDIQILENRVRQVEELVVKLKDRYGLKGNGALTVLDSAINIYETKLLRNGEKDLWRLDSIKQPVMPRSPSGSQKGNKVASWGGDLNEVIINRPDINTMRFEWYEATVTEMKCMPLVYQLMPEYERWLGRALNQADPITFLMAYRAFLSKVRMILAACATKDTFSGPAAGGLPGGKPKSPTITAQDLANATVVDDKRPAIDPKKYIDCFGDGKIAQSYKITIYVDQPIPGTNAQFSTVLATTMYGLNLSKEADFFNVGHTFVGFEKINTDGSSVRQYLGFYPDPADGTVKSKGVIKDDSGHRYNISYATSVNEAQFGLALSELLNDSKGSKYVLANNLGEREYNCTDAAVNWVSDAGVNIPLNSPRGLFTNTPGDYGQELGKVKGANRTKGNAPKGSGPCN